MELRFSTFRDLAKSFIQCIAITATIYKDNRSKGKTNNAAMPHARKVFLTDFVTGIQYH
jgi:hypothetical protein